MSIGKNKRVLHYDLVYLTDVPYNEPDLLDGVVDWLEAKEDVTAIDIMYVADVENQRWTLKFRVDEKLLADEYEIDINDLE